MSTKHGSLSQQAVKRLQGGELILKGYDNAEIADIVEASTCAVKRWRRKLKENNDDLLCLARKQGSGGVSRLNDEQKQQLKGTILEGAIKAGYPNERWTSKIIADLIWKIDLFCNPLYCHSGASRNLDVKGYPCLSRFLLSQE
jgi:transposase